MKLKTIYLKAPTEADLIYRQIWMQDPATMAYNAGYILASLGYNPENGTIYKSLTEMQLWGQSWLNNQARYFAYIYLSIVNEPIGEIYYYLDNGIYSMGILIIAKYRGNNYSYPALLELEKIAFEQSPINELSDYIPLNRVNAIKTFKKAGFTLTSHFKTELCFNKKQRTQQLLITKKEYLDNKKLTNNNS